MAQAKCKKSIREGNSGVDFKFNNGEIRTIELSELSEAMILNLVIHGICQKVGDSYAGQETVDGCIEKAEELIKRLIADDWKTVRAAGGTRRNSMLLEALMRATGKDEDECREVLEEMDDDQKASLQSHDAIKVHTATIRAERMAEKAEKLAKEKGDVTLEL